MDYLPTYLKGQEFNDVVQTFQDFLNEMYREYIFTNLTSASPLEVSAQGKISILEKINRLTELHDPEYIDPEYIQFFANYLGYTVDIQRGELGVLADADSENLCVQEDVKRYLSFIISNLPNWYKIKATNDAIKIMLYSFGLIGDLVTRFTSDYRQDSGSNWWNFREDISSHHEVPENFYPTSHFLVRIDLDNSSENFSLNDSTRLNVFKATESIRPAQNVMDGILGTSTGSQLFYMRAYATLKTLIKIS